jgi:hypothetical protein
MRDQKIIQNRSIHHQLVFEHHELINETVNKFLKCKHLDHTEKALIIEDIEVSLSKKSEQLFSKSASVIKLTILDLCNSICNNHEDLILLKQKSQLLIEKYQYQTFSIIKKFDREGLLKGENVSFLLEDINGKLIEKLITNVLDQYQSGVLFRTYFYRITENAIRDELRKKAVRIRMQGLTMDNYKWADIPNDMNIHFQASTFGNLLHVLFSTSDRRKFELSMMVIYRIPLHQSDILCLYPFCTKEITKSILSIFGKPYHRLPKSEVWEALNHYIGLLENKMLSVRTLKDWVESNKIKIMEVLLKRHIDLKTSEQKKAADTYMELVIYHYYKKG